MLTTSKCQAAIVAIVLLTLLLTGAACGDDEAATPDDTGAASPEVIKIYAAYPMTGPRPEVGADLLTGSQFAVQWINETGGIKAGPLEGATIELTVIDDAYTPEGAGAAATRFLDDSEAFILMADVSGQVQGAATVLEPRGIATISAFGAASYLYEDNECVFLVSPSGLGFGRVSGAFTGTIGKRIVAIVGDESQMDSIMSAAAEGAKSAGSEIVEDIRYTPGELDFRPVITKAMGLNPDVIGLGGTEVEDGNLLLQLRELGWTGPVVEMRANGYSSAFLNIAAEKALDNFYVTLWFDPKPNPGTAQYEIAQEFEKSYGRAAMRLGEAHGFDAVLTAVAGIEAGAQNREEMCEFLKNVKDVGRVGMLGPVDYSELNTPNSRVLAGGVFEGEPKVEQIDVLKRYEVSGAGDVTLLP